MKKLALLALTLLLLGPSTILLGVATLGGTPATAVVCTPGSGFGPTGESFIRFSSFGHREQVAEACGRLASLVL